MVRTLDTATAVVDGDKSFAHTTFVGEALLTTTSDRTSPADAAVAVIVTAGTVAYRFVPFDAGPENVTATFPRDFASTFA